MSDQQTRQTLQAVGLRLDNARDHLDAAMQHSTALARSMREHEYAINDLHSAAANSMLAPGPRDATLHTIRASAERLGQQLDHSGHMATRIHQALQAADQQLQHADRLVGILAGTEEAVEHAAEVSILTTRATRLNTVVELAIPLAGRAAQQLQHAQEALERGLMFADDPRLDRFERFWSVSHGLVDTARKLSAARGSRDGSELTEHAIRSGTLTSAHARDMLRLHPPGPNPISGAPRGPAR